MSRSVFIASPEGSTGKSIVAFGLLDLLTRHVGKVGVFRPVTKAENEDPVVRLLLAHPAVQQPPHDVFGVTYEEMHHDPEAALAELRDDNLQLAAGMRDAHVVCEKYGDVATTSLLEVWIDETERRAWFLSEITRDRLSNR